MSNALALSPDLVALQKTSEFGSDMGDIAGAGVNFLPRFQLFGGQSNEVKEGKIDIAHFGVLTFGIDVPNDLGKTALISPLCWRSKAMWLKASPKPTSYFNRDSEKFKEYRALADKDGKLGYVYGPEFLVVVSGVGLCAFFLNSKTLRNLATKLNAFCPTESSPNFKNVLCTPQLIKNEEHSWHAPVFAPSDQELQNVPSSEVIHAAMQNFLAPQDQPEEAVEAVKEGETVVR